MRNVTKSGVQPRENDFSMVSPAVFYRVQEGSGATISDALGNGSSMTLAAYATGTPWANTGWLTPNGTDHYAQCAADSHLNNIMRLDQPFGAIYQGLDFYFDGSLSGNLETLVFAGKSAPAVVGGWGIELNTSNAVVITIRGLNASNHYDNAFSGAALTALASTRISMVVEVIYKTASTVDANLYLNGAAASSMTDVSLLPNGSTEPYGEVEIYGDTQGYTIGAQPNGTNTRARLLAGYGSNARIARWWASKHDTYDSSLGLKLAKDLYKYQGEFPRCMYGL